MEKLKELLKMMGVQLVLRTEDDEASDGSKIVRFAAVKDAKSVTVELYEDGEVDVFFTMTQEKIEQDDHNILFILQELSYWQDEKPFDRTLITKALTGDIEALKKIIQKAKDVEAGDQADMNAGADL